jgi:hypothetical protein
MAATSSCTETFLRIYCRISFNAAINAHDNKKGFNCMAAPADHGHDTESPESGFRNTSPSMTPSWTEQDEVLTSLWQKGDKPEQIALALNRSVAAVMTRAARLGLQRRFAPGRDWFG